MATLGIDGLVSGLDTTALINNLMSIESAPQTLLKTKQTTTQNVVTALQGINTRFRSLSSAAEKAADADNWKAFSATSSADSVTATTGTTTQSGSITFSVDAVATRQTSLSTVVATGAELTADNPPTLTLKKANGDLVSVTAASNSLTDMVKAINESDMGITATAVRVSGGSTPTYRLQLTAGTTGTAGAFELYAGDEAAVNAATATRLDASVATAPVDAQITLWKGTAYEQAYTQSSNTFSGLMTGVDVTVSKPTGVGETVTVDVAPDADAVSTLAKNLVGQLSLVLSDITSRQATTKTVGSDGKTTVKGGLLTGDTSTTQLKDQIMRAATYPVDGVSPSTVGIVIEKDGTVTFDADKFAAAVEANPTGVAEFVQSLAGRVQTAADAISDPYDGSLSARIKNQESLITDYGKQIDAWDTRLELRRTSLQATYSALEVTLSNLNSQSSWLSSQISALSSSSS